MRRATPAERCEIGASLCRSARELMRAGIRMRHPDYDERTVNLAMWRLMVEDVELLRAAIPEALTVEP